MEPERDIEKTLRAYAKQRREEGGAAPELHPATRKLLQGEVTQRRNRVRRHSWSWAETLWGTWPRLALTVSSAAAVLVAAFLVVMPALRNDSQMLQAQNETEKDKANTAPADKGLVMAPAETRQTDLAKAREQQGTVRTDFPVQSFAQGFAEPTNAINLATKQADKSLSTPTPAAVPPATPGVRLESPARSATVSTQPVMPVVTPPTLAVQVDALKNELADKSSVVVTQQFARVAVPAPIRTADDSGKPAVLASFRFEQDGNQLRVIDSDGSVYTGAITMPEGATGFDKAASGQAGLAKEVQTTASGAMASRDSQATNAGYSFRVTGTNVSLNQEVVFSGNLASIDTPVVATPRPSGGGGAGGGGGRRGGRGGGATTGQPLNTPAGAAATTNVAADASARAKADADTSSALRFRVQGQAVVGGNRIDINALPVK